MDIRIKKNAGDYEKTHETGAFHERDTAFETCWRLPSDLGNGYLRKTTFKPGLDLYVMDYDLKKSLIINSDSWPSGFGFKFFLAGKMRYKNCSLRDEMVMECGLNRFAYFPVSRGTGKSISCERIKVVTIAMAPAFFCNLVEKDMNRFPNSFSSAATGIHMAPFYRINRNTAFMEVALHQILNCPYHGSTRQIFLESKALELVAYQLEQIAPVEKKKKLISSAERERIEFASEILANNMESPPSFLELARMAGLTHNRLSLGFRETYGVTPFTYLKDIRLNRARVLLREKRGNVTEIAFSVGYGSLSHFAKAFKEKFGISPKKYQQHPC
ncbi:MAG: helix-turn-helix transcriptional regulator [Desulfobacteraceae bacterium]|nr:helix-turn-helix transcriptional regulator [Desulfobacteraceae bacterium]